tara:strand:- start:1473 stop:1637 length:165 start_codon:yes stop_codon:yes gene_type:complete
MSGDFFTHNDQQPPLRKECKASIAMDELKRDLRYKITESMVVNLRYRTGSPMQE